MQAKDLGRVAMAPADWKKSCTRTAVALATMAVAGVTLSSTRAATISKANNNDALNLTTSWVGGVVPGGSDVAQWDGTVTGATSALLGTNLSWQGITVGNAGGAVVIGVGNTLTLGSAGINLTGQNLTISSGLTLGAGNQTWKVATGKTLSLNTGTFTRSSGASLFIDKNGATGTIAAANISVEGSTNLIGPWAFILNNTTNASNTTANGYTFATKSGNDVVAFTAAGTAGNFGFGSSASTLNVDVTNVSTGLSGDRTANTIRYVGPSGTQTYGNGTTGLTFNGLMNAGTGALILNPVSGDGLIRIGANNNNQMVLIAAKNNITIGNRIGDGTGGAGSLLTTGAQTVTLSGANTYTGTTTIAGGTLRLVGSIGSAAAVTVQAGGTLAGTTTTNGSSSISGPLSIAGGPTAATRGTITLTGNGINTLSTGALTLGGGTGEPAQLNFDTGVGADSISLGSNALTAAAGGARITITPGSFAAGTSTLTLLSFASSNLTTGTGTTVGALTLTNPPLSFGVTGTLNVTATEVQLIATGTDASGAVYFSGAKGATWNSNDGTTGNFTTDKAGANFVTALPGANADVVFAVTTPATLASTLGQDFAIKSLKFDSSTIAASVGGSNLLTIGSGGVVLESGNGGATLTMTTLALAASQSFTNNSASLLSVSSAIVNGGNALTVNGTGNAVLSGVISGNGALTKADGGTLTLSAANTFGGGLTVEAGTLTLGAAATAGGTTSGVLTVNGGTLEIGGVGRTFGTLAGVGGTIANNSAAAATLTVGGSNANSTYAGNVANATGLTTGTLALTKTGNGTLTLNGSNSYTGATTVNGGTLVLNGPNGGAGSNVTLSGTVGLTLGNTQALGAASLITVSGGTSVATVTFATDGGDTAYQYGGSSGSTLNVVLDRATSGSTVTHNLSTGTTSGFGGSSGATPLSINFSRGLNVSGTATASFDRLNLSGGSGGSAVINPLAGTRVLIGTVTKTNNVSQTLNLGGVTTENEITGEISNGAAIGANSISLAKSNSSTWTLSGGSTYTGGTTIIGGTLRANANRVLTGNTLTSSSTGTGAVTVNTAGVLAGTGGTGDVTVGTGAAAGGTITAGSGAAASDGVGKLTTGNQTWNGFGTGGGVYAVKFATNTGTLTAGASYDTMDMGTLNVVADAGPTPALFTVKLLKSFNGAFDTTVAGTYTIARATAVQVNGNSVGAMDLTSLFYLDASGLNIPDNVGLSVASVTDANYGGFDVNLTYSPAPEPGTLALLYFAATPLLGRRRRAAA